MESRSKSKIDTNSQVHSLQNESEMQVSSDLPQWLIVIWILMRWFSFCCWIKKSQVARSGKLATTAIHDEAGKHISPSKGSRYFSLTAQMKWDFDPVYRLTSCLLVHKIDLVGRLRCLQKNRSYENSTWLLHHWTTKPAPHQSIPSTRTPSNATNQQRRRYDLVPW